jgi:hypothetical protein
MMTRRKRRAIGPVETLECRADGRAQKIIDTGITRRIVSGRIVDGCFVPELEASIHLSSHLPGEPVFETLIEQVNALIDEQAELPSHVSEFVAKPCVERLRTLTRLCRSNRMRRVPGKATVSLPPSEADYATNDEGQRSLHEALELAFRAGEQWGKLQVARLALIGRRDGQRRANTNRRRARDDRDARQQQCNERAKAVYDELAAQTRRGERQHKGRAFKAAAGRLGVSTRTVQLAFAGVAQTRPGHCAPSG